MKLQVHGVVQGVGFRPAVVKLAVKMDLSGHVRNNGSNVEVILSGGRYEANIFIEDLKAILPPLARIDNIEVGEGQPENDGFVILPSQRGSRSSPIPPDTSICQPCLDELMEPGNRREKYPFTNCTDCGARFSIIEDLPYDRPLTAMGDFPLCQSCLDEYEKMGDRRFHAQTISCPECGPQYTLYDGKGKPTKEGIEGFAKLIEDGKFGIMNGWGGSHIICSLEAGSSLREWYGREQKPFALMFRDEKAVGRYTKANEEELALLASRERPIVLVKKRDRPELDIVSPGLGNVGVMLPYSAVHHLLFKYLDKNIGAVIMTSANPQGEPMAITEDRILKLGETGSDKSPGIGGYLLHNRRIANRCDDSLIVHHAGHNYFIRRSRGFVPVPLPIANTGNFIGLGAHENLTSSIGSGGFIYPSQYIGKSSKYGVMDYLESATHHMLALRGMETVDGIGIDMHPGYGNRKLARKLADEFNCETMEIQHHWAHAASLLVDAGIDEAMVLTLDGTGYGADGNAWGGEVLLASLEKYERTGHLAEFPLLGGEAAVKDPKRLAYAMARLSNREYPILPDEEKIFDKMMATAPKTTSMGRVLDAVSCALEICDTRSYDGEPAMKLERYINSDLNIIDNKYNLIDTFNIKSGIIDHITPFGELLDMIPELPSDKEKQKLASAYVSGLVKALCEVAIETARSNNVKNIGLSGGVAYNIPIVEMFMKELNDHGFELIRHDKVPCGDGGISVGQCAIVGATGKK
ncbi:MAG: carbamoyltransferase HypF [Thermoplasmata archaeon]|nr:carbamoyltransferase HypF [Thermoplasmata archaeon]